MWKYCLHKVFFKRTNFKIMTIFEISGKKLWVFFRHSIQRCSCNLSRVYSKQKGALVYYFPPLYLRVAVLGAHLFKNIPIVRLWNFHLELPNPKNMNRPSRKHSITTLLGLSMGVLAVEEDGWYVHQLFKGAAELVMRRWWALSSLS